MRLRATASQTVGPYFSIGLAPLYRSELFEPGSGAAAGAAPIAITGRVLDGKGEAIVDALLELWQADAQGRYADGQGEHLGSSASIGFGRVPTDGEGAFGFRTHKPGRVVGPSGTLQAPHLNVCLFMRGLLKPVRTRMYFPADPSNADDPILALVPPARRSSLIAQAVGSASLRWEVRMQGEAETVFFEY
jgi:protocatechuate 3,4-dioxygenase alpha subunit